MSFFTSAFVVSAVLSFLIAVTSAFLSYDRAKKRAKALLFLAVISSVATMYFAITNGISQKSTLSKLQLSEKLWRDSLTKNNLHLVQLTDTVHNLTAELAKSYRDLYFITKKMSFDEIESRRRLGGGDNIPVITFQALRLVDDSILLSFQCANSSDKYPLQNITVYGNDGNAFREYHQKHYSSSQQIDLPFPAPGNFIANIGDLRADDGAMVYERKIGKHVIQFEITFRVKWS